ncbi:hypothetical protein AX16_011030 [Volvariella volvacea WC 439]|nr:hypothetical protein AX16_011030 [Volvariella volvacea WC 439]
MALTLTIALKLLLLPIVSIAYLGFCWTVYHRTVLVNGRGLINTSAEGLGVIKSGITTINILTIALGLWPVKTLLMDVKGEEFFRSLRRSSAGSSSNPRGINLATAHSISTPSLGAFETLTIILQRHCSLYLTVAFITGFIMMATSVLAPAALSIQEVMCDLNETTFEVAAMPPSSVAVSSTTGLSLPSSQYYLTDRMERKLQEAASITWAEGALDVVHSFEVNGARSKFAPSDPFRYIVPIPTNLSPMIPVRWFTDAFVLQPSCSWQETNISGTVPLQDVQNPSSTNPSTVINLPELGIGILLPVPRASSSGINPGFHLQYLSMRPAVFKQYWIFNSTTGDLPYGGHSIWSISQYRPNTTTSMSLLTFDARGLPTFGIRDNLGGIWEIAILACSPNFTIQTVEVQNKGKNLTVISTRSVSNGEDTSSAGNLDRREGDFFFSSIFTELTVETSPAIPWAGSGSQVQASLMFGWDQVKAFNPNLTDQVYSPNNPVVWSPMAIPDITSMYSRYLQSAAKLYMSGALGTARVSGFVRQPVTAFSVSIGHIIPSTILLIILNIINILAFFRSGKGELFNLLTIGSVLHESNVPADMAKFKEDNPNIEGEELDRAFRNASKDRLLKLDPRSEDNKGPDVLTVHDTNIDSDTHQFL